MVRSCRSIAGMTSRKSAHARGGDIFGWRVIARLGPLRVLRVLTAAYLLAHVARIILVDAPYLLDPMHTQSDVWTYFAAGQRLRDGHQLYALQAGDLPVYLAPPYVTAPLLSPPLIGVIFRPLATYLDPWVATHAWLWVSWIVFAVTIAILIRRGSALLLCAFLVMAPAIALTGVSGNLNALLVPLLVAAWWWADRGRPAGTGVAIAVAAALKVTPGFLVVWLVARRAWRGLAAFALAFGALGLLSLVVAGPANTFAYLDVIGYTSGTGVSGWSLPVTLAGLGLDLPATGVLVGVAAAGAVLVFVLRRRPGLSWAVANIMSVIANPVLHLVAASLLVPGLAPAATSQRPEPQDAIEDAAPSERGRDGRS
jgi:hypothetical protein